MKKSVFLRLIVAATALSLCLTALLFTACGSNVLQPDENTVVIEVPEDYDAEGKTLYDYMTELAGSGGLTFTIEDGMVTAINGRANTTNSYWMVYTSDEAHANAEWGVMEYEGKEYGSATLGAESLPLAAGGTYIWAYQTF